MAELERRADMAEIIHTVSKIGTEVTILGQKLDANTEMTKKVHDKLYGNGVPGIGTDLEVTKSSLKRAWWFIGVLGVGLIGGMVKVIFA